MKKISAFLFLFCLAASLSFYQSCKHSRRCLLVNSVASAVLDKKNNRILNNNDSVAATDLSIQIWLRTLQFSCKKENTISFISDAMANQPVIDLLYYDTLKNIRISCLQDFDSTHLAGSALNDYFSPDQTFNTENGLQAAYVYNLLTPPDSSRAYEFRISVEFVNGSIFDTILPPVKIK